MGHRSFLLCDSEGWQLLDSVALFLFFILFYYYYFLHVCVGDAHVCSEDNTLSFHHVGPRDGT